MATAIHRYLIKHDYIDDGNRITDAYHEAKAQGTLAELPPLVAAYAAQVFQLIDGVFSDDPEKNPHAVLYSQLSYEDVLRQNLRVMDTEAIAKCKQYEMPIMVFNFRKEGNIEKAVTGERVGTLISTVSR